VIKDKKSSEYFVADHLLRLTNKKLQVKRRRS